MSETSNEQTMCGPSRIGILQALAMILGLAPWAVLLATYEGAADWFHITLVAGNLGLVVLLFHLLLAHRRQPLFRSRWIFVPVYPATVGGLLLLVHITFFREDQAFRVFGLLGSALGIVAMLVLVQYVCLRLRRYATERHCSTG